MDVGMSRVRTFVGESCSSVVACRLEILCLSTCLGKMIAVIIAA